MKNKTVLITGGHSGLGLELVKKFHKKGYNVISIGRTKNIDLLSSLKERYEQITISLDRTSAQEVFDSKFIEKIDILINNAGETTFGDFSTLETTDILKNIETNFTVPALTSHLFLKHARENSTLVNVTSITGRVFLKDNLLYSICKGAISDLTYSLRYFDERGVNLNIIDFCPGSISTEFHKKNNGKSLLSKNRMPPQKAAEILISSIESKKNKSIFPDFKSKIIGFFLPKLTYFASRILSKLKD